MMARDRDKYEYAIRLEFKSGFNEQAEYDFDAFVEYFNQQRADGTKVRTKIKHKTGNQKFDEFLIIVR